MAPPLDGLVTLFLSVARRKGVVSLEELFEATLLEREELAVLDCTHESIYTNIMSSPPRPDVSQIGNAVDVVVLLVIVLVHEHRVLPVLYFLQVSAMGVDFDGRSDV